MPLRLLRLSLSLSLTLTLTLTLSLTLTLTQVQGHMPLQLLRRPERRVHAVRRLVRGVHLGGTSLPLLGLPLLGLPLLSLPLLGLPLLCVGLPGYHPYQACTGPDASSCSSCDPIGDASHLQP